MLPFAVMWGKWLFFALLGGGALALWLVLAYFPFWQVRPEREDAKTEDEEQSLPTRRWARAYMPWALTLLFAGITVWAASYMIHNMMHPPNW